MKEEVPRIPLPLKTERLLLRPYFEEDADAFAAYMSDPEALRFEPYLPLGREDSDRELAKRCADPDFIAICLPPEEDHPFGKLIGHIFFSPCAFSTWEIGWMLDRSCWGMGFAYEAAAAVVAAAFDAAAFDAAIAHRVIAMCNPENIRSERLMQKLGMRKEGQLIKNLYFETDETGSPVWLDTAMYAILREEW